MSRLVETWKRGAKSGERALLAQSTAITFIAMAEGVAHQSSVVSAAKDPASSCALEFG